MHLENPFSNTNDNKLQNTSSQDSKQQKYINITSKHSSSTINISPSSSSREDKARIELPITQAISKITTKRESMGAFRSKERVRTPTCVVDEDEGDGGETLLSCKKHEKA